MELSVASNQAIPCIPNMKNSRYLYVFLPNFVDRTKWPPPPGGAWDLLRTGCPPCSARSTRSGSETYRCLPWLHQYVRPLVGIDERTLEVCAVEITSSNLGDAPMLPELLDQIPSDREIGSVTPDGAYDTRKGHDAIAGRGADAVIPTRKNAKPWTPDTVGARARNDILRATKHPGRALWRDSGAVIIAEAAPKRR